MAEFRFEVRKFLRFSKDYLTKARLTTEQYEALLAIRAVGSQVGLLVGQLSDRLQVRHHTAVALTNKLVKQGLITKERSCNDRRQVAAQLTKEGLKVLESAARVHRQAIRTRSPAIIKVLALLQN